ncbi:MAG: hypothetical protein ACK54H_05760 [Phycisphaerales bacterium]
MNDIRHVIARASKRLWMTDAFKRWAVTLTIPAAIFIVCLLIDRIGGTAILARIESGALKLWQPILGPFGGSVDQFARTDITDDSLRFSTILFVGVPLLMATFIAAALWAWFTRPSTVAVARHVDEAAGLKESLSTSLYIERSDDPWSRAVIETASQAATQVDVRSAVPIDAPRAWPIPLGTFLAFLVMFLAIPHADLSGEREQIVQERKKQEELVKVKAENDLQQKKLEELVRKANVDVKLDDASKDASDGKKPEERDPDAFRRGAVKQLTSVAEQLQKLKEDEKAPQLEALREKMQQLRQPGPGPLDDFSRQLARGDFNKAQQALEQIQKELGDASMSAEQKEQLKKQLENLAKQLEKAGDAQKQVEKELQKEGLDKKSAEELAKKAAQSPDELKKALEQMQGLTDQQKLDMMKMAMSQMKAASQCENMSESMSEMAKGMTQEGMQSDESMQAMDELSKELSDMEMMQSDMENLQAALDETKDQLAKLGECLGGQPGKEGECEGGPKIGSWKPGEGRKVGQGSGGPGRGNGPSPDAEAADYQVDKKKAEVKNVGGPVIGSRLVYGEQIKGTSTASFAEAVRAAEEQAAEDINNHQIPREYQDAVKTYFGRLQERVKKDKPTESTPDKKESGK